MNIDVRVGGARNQFAAQIVNIQSSTFESIDGMFIGDETTDFYEGLLAGVAFAYQLLKTTSPKITDNYLGATISYISGEKYKK